MASQVSREQPDIHNKRKEDNSFVQEEVAKRAKSNGASTHPIVPIIAVPNNVIPADGSAFVVHLANTKVEDIKTREGKIFFGLKDDPIKTVYKGLIAHNFSSCPVLQKTKHRWCGFLDLGNIVKFIVKHFGESVVSAENVNIMQLLQETENFKGLQVLDIMKNPMGILTPYHPIYAGYSLLAAYEVMARSNLHQLAVIDSERKLISVVTQSQMVEETFKYIELLGAKRSKLVNSMSYNMHEVYHVNPKDLAIAAFTVMSENKVSGIAVIDDDGMLVDQISLRDLKAMGPDAHTFWRLFKPVSEYIENVKKSHTDAHAKERPNKIVTVTPNDTIETVLGLLVTYKIHRVYIVEDANKPKPIGLITLRDIMLEAIPGGHW